MPSLSSQSCPRRLQWIASLLILLIQASANAASPTPTLRPEPLYERRQDHDPNGIGKFFMGREIAFVMGHQGAGWLERTSREAEEKTSKLVELLKVKPGDVIADVGAGTGYLTRRISPLTGPKGRIYAVDVQPEMIQLLTNQMKAASITNVVPVLGTDRDPKLPPQAIDLIVMVDVYHEFEFPYEMTEAMVRALKPGGRLAFVEFRKEDAWVPIKEVHKMSEAQVKKEMSLHPLEWVETLRDLPRQHLIVFRKRG
ncbi:MAG: class I SAM-dependent methyltransferase [Verrucomicrobia bacterium]|nr:class I SAM-dependent methyltransferase [Verrucomicrobiota bacterium]